MLNTLAQALKKVVEFGRVDDEAYATRILFNQIVGSDWSQELGYGITIDKLCDNEHKIPVVDFADGSVTLYDIDHWSGEKPPGTPIFTTSIDRFITRYAKD